MIPKPYIAAWQSYVPWKEFAQVEQDLIISRTLVEIFSDNFLREHLAFRGGTALHKLYLNPAQGIRKILIWYKLRQDLLSQF